MSAFSSLDLVEVAESDDAVQYYRRLTEPLGHVLVVCAVLPELCRGVMCLTELRGGFANVEIGGHMLAGETIEGQ